MNCYLKHVISTLCAFMYEKCKFEGAMYTMYTMHGICKNIYLSFNYVHENKRIHKNFQFNDKC